MAVEKKTILVVEDDVFYAKVCRNFLSKEGYEILEAHNGIEALDMALEHAPDIVLLDILMPEMDGFQVLKRLRADDQFKDMPILVLSNLAHQDDVTKAMELGATDYLIKAHSSLKELETKIAECCG